MQDRFSISTTLATTIPMSDICMGGCAIHNNQLDMTWSIGQKPLSMTVDLIRFCSAFVLQKPRWSHSMAPTQASLSRTPICGTSQS